MNREKFSNNESDQFDLDDYLEEQSSGQDQSIKTSSSNPQKKSSWFRNTIAIFGLAIVTLLYFNDWSPTLVYGNIFGVEEYQKGFVEPSARVSGLNTNSDMVIMENEVANITEEALANAFESLESLEGLEGLEVLENLENLEQLENSLAEMENLEEMNGLRNFALETAMEALSGIGESGQFGNEVQLGIQEALRELESLRELETNGLTQLVDDATEVNSSFSEYSSQLENNGISDVFNSSDIQKLHKANVSPAFLKQLDDLNLLEKLNVDSIIEAYNQEE